MSFRKNIVNARSNIAFVTGLCLAAGIAWSVEKRGELFAARTKADVILDRSGARLPLAPARALSDEDWQAAATAWAYFKRNTQETGLVNSVDGFPSTTMWDQGSYLLGLISAHGLGLVDDAEFNDRIRRALDALARIQLFDGMLPNKAYDTRSLLMTNYQNEQTDRGLGWSALDIARIAVPLSIILYDHPEHAPAAAQLLRTWRVDAMMREGQLFGARVNPETGATELVQEGRLGYEEYGARAIALLGVDSLSALKYDDYLKFETVSGVEIGVDSRSYEVFDANNYVVSESYVLTAVEFGLDQEAEELARRVYEAQENRYKETGILTAVSEDNLDQAPWFIYNTVYANGKAWNAMTEEGEDISDLRTVSAKAVFGWDAIFDTDYTRRLRYAVADAFQENGGWFAGLYEADGSKNEVMTANTNGIILQTLFYRQKGPMLSARYANSG